MAIMNFADTNIPENYSKALFNEATWDLTEAQSVAMADVYVTGVSNLLKDLKSKEMPTAFIFDEPNGNFIIAAIVRFIPNENEEMPGHWNYVWTFNKEDIPAGSKEIRPKDADIQIYFRVIAAQKYTFGFKTPAACVDCGNFLFKHIRKWLVDNAKADEEIGVTLDGIFQARAAVEDNEVVLSFEVIGETKAIIKSDADNEV